MDARWLEYINDKWANFANFFVSGFFEAIYTVHDTTYVQIEAKIIDYDARFRHPSSPLENLTSSPTSPSTNIFAQRRSKLTSEHSPRTPKHSISRNDSVTMQEGASEEESDMQGGEIDPDKDDDDKSTTSYNQNEEDSIMPHKSKKKRQLLDLCNSDDDSNETIKKNQPHSEKGSRRGSRGRRGRRGHEK